jgi:AcrR family transcriptional regulator
MLARRPDVVFGYFVLPLVTPMAGTRPYVKVARADAESRTRTALMDAATRAFFEEDWERISLARIAAEAGVTKQTLLRHFGSRDGLVEACFVRAMDEVGAQRSEAAAGDLAGAVDNLLDHYEAVGDRALKLEAMRSTPRVEGFVQAGREIHYEWVGRVFEPWLVQLAPSERHRVRAALIALCDVHTWRLLSRHLGLPRAEVRTTLIGAISKLIEEER